MRVSQDRIDSETVVRKRTYVLQERKLIRTDTRVFEKAVIRLSNPTFFLNYFRNLSLKHLRFVSREILEKNWRILINKMRIRKILLRKILKSVTTSQVPAPSLLFSKNFKFFGIHSTRPGQSGWSDCRYGGSPWRSKYLKRTRYSGREKESKVIASQGGT